MPPRKAESVQSQEERMGFLRVNYRSHSNLPGANWRYWSQIGILVPNLRVLQKNVIVASTATRSSPLTKLLMYLTFACWLAE